MGKKSVFIGHIIQCLKVIFRALVTEFFEDRSLTYVVIGHLGNTTKKEPNLKLYFSIFKCTKKYFNPQLFLIFNISLLLYS